MTIHIIPYTHADYAWTHSRKWHDLRYAFILNEVLDMMAENKELTYTLDNLVFLWSLEGREAEVKKLIEEERLEIMCGAISMVRPTQIDAEAFVRNVQLGHKYLAEKYGDVPIKTYLNADTAIGHIQIPQLMSLFGIRYYRGWRPEAQMDEAGIPRQFIWKGPDGSEIITSRGPYHGCWDATGDLYEDELKELTKVTKSAEIWFSQGMDDTRLLRDSRDLPLNLEPIIDKYNMKFSTPSEYFRALEKTNLPVVEGVLDNADVAYNLAFMGGHSLCFLRHKLNRELIRLEKLCVLSASLGFNTPDLEEAWHNYIFLCGHAMSVVFTSDYEELLRLYHKVNCFVVSERENLFKDISKLIGGDIVAINTELMPRTTFVNASLVFPLGGYDFDLIDSNGNITEYQILNKTLGDISYGDSGYVDIEILFKANLPAMGYASYNILASDIASCDKNVTTQTPVFASSDSELIPENFTSLATKAIQSPSLRWSKSEHSSLIDEAIHNLFNSEPCSIIYKQKPNDLFLTDEVLCEETFIVEKTEIKEAGPLRWRIVDTGKLGKAIVSKERTIYENTTSVDYKIEISIAHKECGYYAAVFPCSEDPKLICGIPFGSEIRNLSKIPYGKKYDKFWKNLEHQWEKVFYSKDFLRFDDNVIFGTGIQGYYKQNNNSMEVLLFRTINTDTLSDWQGRIHLGVAGVGHHVFTFSHQVNSDLTHYNEPDEPLIYTGFPGQGRGAAAYSLLELKGISLTATAFYRQNDKNILRFYENAGNNDTFSLITDLIIDNLKKIDLTGKEMEFTYNVKPHEIVTLEFELK